VFEPVDMKRPTPTVLLLLALQSCTSEPRPNDPPPPARATWSKDIAPLYGERCVSCHKTGGIAPFSLETYDDARLMAARALEAVRSRVMPPWLVTGDGSCQTFDDSRWMSDGEIAKLAAWVEDGTPMGEAVSAIEGESEETLGAEAFEVEMSEPYIPRADPERGYPEDDYRCFLIDPALAEDRFVTAFEVVPGDPTQVHHMLVFDVDPTLIVGADAQGQPITNGNMIDAHVAANDRYGWSCFGAAGEGIVPSGLPVVWAPGVNVTRYPAGTGLFLPTGHVLVMQIHYHLHHEERADRTKLRLELAEQVEQPGFILLPDGFLQTAFTPAPAMLPPGMSDVPYTWKIPAKPAIDEIRAAIGSPSAQVSLYGAVPHMHRHGRSMSVSVGAEGESSTCIADVFRWDYDWQRFYFYREPIPLAEDHVLETTCHFDTTGATEPIFPGLGSNDEMCLFGMYVVVTP
jgi:hypothetical protein